MIFIMLNPVTNELKKMKFTTVEEMWKWYDKSEENKKYIPYDKSGNKVYRVAIIR